MSRMTCDRFEEILVDYFEGDLPSETKAAADAHAKECESCARIVTDIDRITRDAAALPPMKPSRDLWVEIEDRISAPVIALTPAHRSSRRFTAPWMAAAAAALIVTTAGVTYLATSRTTASPATQVATNSAMPVTPTVDTVPAAGATVPSPANGETQTPSVAANGSSAPRSSAALASNSGPRTPRATNAGVSLGSPQADAQYAHEIEILERMISSPSSGLDTSTVRIVKNNLQVIDDAIAQSKAALAKDPASPLLYNQMTRAMGKKVELLRTMVSLSSSTE